MPRVRRPRAPARGLTPPRPWIPYFRDRGAGWFPAGWPETTGILGSEQRQSGTPGVPDPDSQPRGGTPGWLDLASPETRSVRGWKPRTGRVPRGEPERWRVHEDPIGNPGPSEGPARRGPQAPSMKRTGRHGPVAPSSGRPEVPHQSSGMRFRTGVKRGQRPRVTTVRLLRGPGVKAAKVWPPPWLRAPKPKGADRVQVDPGSDAVWRTARYRPITVSTRHPKAIFPTPY